MRGSLRSFHLLLFGFALSTVACGGGGGGGGGIQPPPPQPDFTVSVSSPFVDISQGGTSAPVNVAVFAKNGFSSQVEVIFSGLPAGISTNPGPPISVGAGSSVSVLFDASTDVASGQFSVTAQATSGSLTHSAGFTLDIHDTVPVSLPHSTFVPNDSLTLLDFPPNEPRHRHLAYDAATQRLYVANRAMNRVEVWNAATPSIASTVDAPGAFSVDLSPDAETLWVGTNTEQILAIDTVSLQVRARYPVSGLTPIPGVVFNRPTELLALSSGKLALRLRQSGAAQALLSLWDPASNSFTNLTSTAPAVFQNGVGVLARSGDRVHVLAAAADSSGELAVFDSLGNLVAGPSAPFAGAIPIAAASPDGSRYAVIVTTGGNSQLHLLDARLNILGRYATRVPAGLAFSPDAQTLYIDESFGNSYVVTALDANNLQALGQVPDIPIQGIPTNIEQHAASPFLCGLGNRGVTFLDISRPGSLSPTAPAFAVIPVAQPAEGPSTGGTSTTLSGSNFASNPQVTFGGGNLVDTTLLSNSQLQAISTPGALAGPVNLTAYFSSGWLAVAPNAFSYGPAIVRILPNSGSTDGGDTITVLGYGFGASSGNLKVTLGGQTSTIVTADQFPAFRTTLGLDTTYPFPLERIVLKTPPGSAGKVDLSIHSPSGSTTTSKSFQYLSSSHRYANAALHKFILYDSSRQALYMSATDHIDVFDLNAQVFLPPIWPPPNGPPPSAALRGLALTPDHSQIVVADFGSQNVYLSNPTGAAYNGTSVHVGGVAGFLNSGPARVATTSAQTVFVGLTGEGNSYAACNKCLGQMNLLAFPPSFAPAPQPEVASLTGAPLFQADAAGDIVYLAYNTAPGGPLASWNSAAPNEFFLSSATDTATDLAASPGGSLFAVRAHSTTEIRGPDLALSAMPTGAELEAIPNRVAVPGVALHPTGALVYEPFLDGPPPAAPPATGLRGGVDIRDAHNGQLRLRVYFPEPFAMLNTDTDGLHGGFLTIDENGQRLFALTTSGLAVVQLASVPLGIGTLSPSAGSAAGGVVVTLRGSGFVNGVKATLGGESTNVTWKDINTLTFATPATSVGPQQIKLTNPDGETVSLDAAFLAQ